LGKKLFCFAVRIATTAPGTPVLTAQAL